MKEHENNLQTGGNTTVSRARRRSRAARRPRNAWSYLVAPRIPGEFYHNAAIGKYRLVSLTQRGGSKSRCRFIRSSDSAPGNDGRKNKKPPFVLERLAQAIDRSLENEKQTILFSFRRFLAQIDDTDERHLLLIHALRERNESVLSDPAL